MENDIHPERPRPVEPGPQRARSPWLDPVVIAVLPGLGANVSFSILLGFPLIDTIWFGAAASGLAAWSLHLQTPYSVPRTPDPENRLPILVALIIAFACFGLAWKAAAVFASAGIAALAFAIGSLCLGVEAARSRAWSFAFLLFAFPWTDPSANLLGYPWRDFLATASGAIARPLIGAVTVQGTTLGADSIKIAIPPEGGGLWQAQFFLLCALGLAAGSGWKTSRLALWFCIAALSAGAAFLGFVTSFVVASVLAAAGLTPVWAGVLEIGWWMAAFGALAWLSWKWRVGPSSHDPAKKTSQRMESMFPEDAVRRS